MFTFNIDMLFIVQYGYAHQKVTRSLICTTFLPRKSYGGSTFHRNYSRIELIILEDSFVSYLGEK